MKKKSGFLIILSLIVILVLAELTYVNYFPSSVSDSTIPINLCIQKCKEEFYKKTDLSNGPCLSNQLSRGWVCDVAHNPRSDLDNKPENQCSEYGKSANHFVEVDLNCDIIRSV